MEISIWDHFSKEIWTQADQVNYDLADVAYPAIRQTLADGGEEWPSVAEIKSMPDPYTIFFSLILLIKSVYEKPRLLEVSKLN